MKKRNWLPTAFALLIPALFVMQYTAMPYKFYADDTALLYVAFQHAGQRVSGYDNKVFLKEQAKQYREELKANSELKMNLKSKPEINRERFPISVSIFIDDHKLQEREYEAGGRKKDLAAVVYEAFKLKPGRHKIKVIMKDSKREGLTPYVFEDTVEFKPLELKVVTFDKQEKSLVWVERSHSFLSSESEVRKEG